MEPGTQYWTIRFCLTLFVVFTAFSSDQPKHGAFTIQERNGVQWLVRPDGEYFFSLGVCCVDQGASREKYETQNPAYGGWRHYSDSNEWASATAKRLKSWGFSTIGGWSDFEA